MFGMSKIRVLSQDIISKIAAGEVVERPANVVKELLENSLDSGASEIRVSVSENKIVVSDNGEGMSKEDLRTCFLPHSTSKIYELSDLENIATLGFRGEALSSICAVSRVTISSRTKRDTYGSRITVTEGVLDKEAKLGMKVGTEVAVEDLYFNTPARKKFLKNEKTEFSCIQKTVSAIALAYPSVKFNFSHNGKTVFILSKCTKLGDRIREVLGDYFLANLIEIKLENRYFSASGFIGHPNISSLAKENQHLFVNSRPVENESISRGIRMAFGKLLDKRKFPALVINMQIAPSLVDPNVHPRKEKIAFWDEKFVEEVFTTETHNVLQKSNLTFVYDTGSEAGAALEMFLSLKDSVKAWDINIRSSSNEILQVDKTYLTCVVDQGLLLVDQHAAHESILFEEYLGGLKNSKNNSQIHVFIKPKIIDLKGAEIEDLDGFLALLTGLGIEAENFGGNSCRVLSVPKMLKDHNLNILLKELAEMGLTGMDTQTEKTIEFLACRSAVKAGDYLDPDERKRLIEKLLESNSYLTCPHGRPTKVLIPLSKLRDLFLR